MNTREVIVVDLDWSSTGIWLNGGNVSYDRFNIPPWLLARFEFWSWWYNRWEPWRNTQEEAQLREPDEELFDAYGLSIAIDLQRHLGPTFAVLFRRKTVSCDNLPSPISIEEVYDHLSPETHPKSSQWSEFFPISSEQNQGEQDGGGNALDLPSHQSTVPSKSRATPLTFAPK